MTTHRLLFFLYCILYLSTYFPLSSLSTCIYNESYIYLTTTNYTKYNGVYIRNLTKGVWIGPDAPTNCGRPATDLYEGTYIYETQSTPRYYLWMFHNLMDVGNGLKIGTVPCSAGEVLFETDDIETSPILNGTNCRWSAIDTAGGITWQKTGADSGPVDGTFELCDTTEACDTPNPTSAPTKSPIPTTAAPSTHPTTAQPSSTPTQPTDTPSKYPTRHPTTKPTQLPTHPGTVFKEPPCIAMVASNLDKAFPLQAEYEEEFNELVNITYNQRRVWSNGDNRIEIFYTDRYEPNRWIVSNGTYHLINDGDHLVDGGVNNSFPGDDGGFGLYDHFPNDNPFREPTDKYTLRFICLNTSSKHPTKPPTPSPSTSPTKAPSTSPSQAPTAAPTIECGKLIWEWKEHNITGDVLTDCIEQSQFDSSGIHFAEQDYRLDNHSWWRNLLWTRTDVLFYSVMFDGWILNHEGETGNFGEHALYLEAPFGLEIPPPDAVWKYFDHGDYWNPICYVEVTISCDVKSPTREPASPPPTPSPTIAPSDSPSYSPSGSPTQPPSVAPSQPPSAAPTGAPTLLCGGLTLDIAYEAGEDEDYELFRGSYRRQEDDDLMNGRHWWLSRENPGSFIFYSEVVFHNSWVIRSREAQTYWLYPEYNPYIHVLQPPLVGEWHYYTSSSPFAADRREITLHCTKSLLPTPAPTAAPTAVPTQPPSAAPSLTPSNAPSSAPSFPPSAAPTFAPTTPSPTSAPSLAPSLAPTAPPTREACAFMQVYAEDPSLAEFNGIYTKDIDRNGFAAWFSDSSTGLYFIEKTSNGLYWTINNYLGVNGGSISSNDLVTIDNNYNWRPPEYGDWLLWETRPNPTTAPTEPTSDPTTLPTMEPTMDPTFIPTLNPTREPTGDPTLDPTSDPTIDPTFDPTQDPTFDPTMEPTIPTEIPSPYPTGEPTGDPTMEPTVPTDIPTGYPTQEPTMDPTMEPTIDTDVPTTSPTQEPTSDTTPPTVDPTLEPTVEPTEEPTTDPTTEPTAIPTEARRRALLQVDPPQGTQVYGTKYKIVMDCVNTGSPTVDPTTFEPTMAPTSICHSLQIEAANDPVSVDVFPYYGEYIQSHYNINGYVWFLSYDGLSSLQYLRGQWSVQREDKDDGNDEDTILIYRDEMEPDPLKWLLQSPQNKAWYSTYHDIDIYLNINCIDSTPPTPAPTLSPSSSPTTETEPIWVQCTQNWFTFINPEAITANKSGVYWDEPIAEGVGAVNVEIIENNIENEHDIEQGDELDTGVYSILYRATNIYNKNNSNPLYSECEIILYVIGDTSFDTRDYCLDSAFTVNIDFNETFQEVFITDTNNNDEEETEYEVSDIVNIDGFATNPELDENCYIFGRKVFNVTLITESPVDTKTFLGIESSAIIWDVLILLILICLIALCIFRICVYHKQYKEKKAQSDSKQALLNPDAERRERRERIASDDIQDDDDDVMDDIDGYGPGATTNKADGALLSSVEPGVGQYAPPQRLSEGDDDEINRNETAGGDAAIDALIGEAFDSDPVLVTPDGGGLHPAIEMQPMDKKASSFDDGGPLPEEQLSDPVLVTPDALAPPIDIEEDDAVGGLPVPDLDDIDEEEDDDDTGGLPVPDLDDVEEEEYVDEEEYVNEEEYVDEADYDDVAPLVQAAPPPNLSSPYNDVADQSIPDLADVADNEVPVASPPKGARLVSNDEYAELEDDDESDGSEFEFHV